VACRIWLLDNLQLLTPNTQVIAYNYLGVRRITILSIVMSEMCPTSHHSLHRQSHTFITGNLFKLNRLIKSANIIYAGLVPD
jgi:hypothetical protein